MEMACGKLELHLSGTRGVLGEHAGTLLPAPTTASPHPCRGQLPAAPRHSLQTANGRSPGHQGRPPGHQGCARCCTCAWGGDKSSGGDEHRSRPGRLSCRYWYHQAPGPQQSPSPPHSRLRQDFFSLFLWLRLPAYLH